MKMGQRHQVYVKLPYQNEFPTDEIGYVEKNDIIGLHHQWLFGTLPLRQLIQFMKFYNKNKLKRNFIFGTDTQYMRQAESALNSLYSLNLQDGTYSETSPLVQMYVKEPLSLDNNDGVTLIDLSDSKKPKYAFLFFGDTDSGKALTPLTAEQYIRDYYNPRIYQDINLWNEKSIAYMEKDIQTLLKAFQTKKSFEVLSLKEVQNRFPAFYDQQQKR